MAHRSAVRRQTDSCHHSVLLDDRESGLIFNLVACVDIMGEDFVWIAFMFVVVRWINRMLLVCLCKIDWKMQEEARTKNERLIVRIIRRPKTKR